MCQALVIKWLALKLACRLKDPNGKGRGLLSNPGGFTAYLEVYIAAKRKAWQT
jgi:hypothetical protein